MRVGDSPPNARCRTRSRYGHSSRTRARARGTSSSASTPAVNGPVVSTTIPVPISSATSTGHPRTGSRRTCSTRYSPEWRPGAEGNHFRDNPGGASVRIAIIGVGNVGSALARACNLAGHAVVVSSRNPAHAGKVADELKVAVAASNREAVQDAGMVVLAVPAKAVAAVLDDIAELVVGTIVVDPTNAVDTQEVILRASASLAEAVVL